jgi:hypothetical protein
MIHVATREVKGIRYDESWLLTSIMSYIVDIIRPALFV